MLRKLCLAVVLFFIVGLGVFWFITIPATVPASALGPYTPNLDNGKEMFFAGGCPACHAIPNKDLDKIDPTRLGGGLGLHSPFGTFYEPNISPDLNDGIGKWSEANFITAMTKGTSPEGSHYFPAFPYTSYQRMKFSDLRDLFAYLKTLPAVEGRVRDHNLPFPFNIRRILGVWKLLFLDGKRFETDPSKSAQWNRGAYLINGPGHCAECHSPRNILGGIVSGQRFAGGPSADGEKWVPNITQKRLTNLNVEDFELLLETGELPDDRVNATMMEVVNNIAKLTSNNRTAMAIYLKSLPPVEGPPRK